MLGAILLRGMARIGVVIHRSIGPVTPILTTNPNEQSQHQTFSATEQGHACQHQEIRESKSGEEGKIRPLQFVRQRNIARGG